MAITLNDATSNEELAAVAAVKPFHSAGAQSQVWCRIRCYLAL